MHILLVIFLPFAVVLAQEDRCFNTHPTFESQSDLSEMLPSPSPTNVTVEIWIDDVKSLDIKSSALEMSVYFTEMWQDERYLTYDIEKQCSKKTVMTNGKYLNKIWTPKLEILQSLKSNLNRPSENDVVVVYENGTLWRNYKTPIVFGCTVDLRKFPKDVQTCSMSISSLIYNEDQISLQWKLDSPIMILKQLRLAQYSFTSVTASAEIQAYPMGLYTELKATFTFQRLYGWHMIHFYMPSLMLVIVSWIAFSLGQAITARAFLGVGSMLALIILYNFVLADLPKISYKTNMDLWMGVCMLFIFLSLLELSLFAVLARSFCTNYSLVNSQTDNETTRLLLSDNKSKFRRASKVPTIVDIVFAILFPVGFIIFNVVYWNDFYNS